MKTTQSHQNYLARLRKWSWWCCIASYAPPIGHMTWLNRAQIVCYLPGDNSPQRIHFILLSSFVDHDDHHDHRSWNYISGSLVTSAVGTNRSGAKYHRLNRELRYWKMIWLIWVYGICWQYHENHIKSRINNFLSWASQSLWEDDFPL